MWDLKFELRASMLPNIREWLLSRRFSMGHDSGSKVILYWPRRAIRDNVAPLCEWLRVKDHVPPRTELHREGFKVLSSIQIQQTIYSLDE